MALSCSSFCFMLSLRIFWDPKLSLWISSPSHFANLCVKTNLFPWERREISINIWLTFQYSQPIRNSRALMNASKKAGGWQAGIHQSSHGLATRVHGFSTKTTLAREIPSATQARGLTKLWCCVGVKYNKIIWFIGLIIRNSHRKEIRKLAFRALPLRRNESRISLRPTKG